MPVDARDMQNANIAGPLGSLVLSVVRAASPMMVVRALRWYRDLARLGLHLPFFMVHDIGLLLAAPRDQLLIGARPAMSSVGTRSQVLLDLHRTYSDLVDEIDRKSTRLNSSH